MRPSYNVLSPSSGEVILKPTQDMVIGCYYLTMMIKKYPSLIKKWFSNEKEAITAFSQKKINLHTPILVRYSPNSFKIKSEKENLLFLDNLNFLNVIEKPLTIHRIFSHTKKNIKKYFLFTNLGILILEKREKHSITIFCFFLEITAGRLIFSTNFRNSIMI
jgi:DNA-directed RNA polymerase beta' subunit